MRKLGLIAAGALAIGLASAAQAQQPTVQSGTNELDNMIHLDSSKDNEAGTNTVYGITNDGTEVEFMSTTSTIAGEESGNGYAQVHDFNDEDGNVFTDLIISLADLSGFTAYEFSVLYGPQISGTLSIYYSALGGGIDLNTFTLIDTVDIATGNQDFLVRSGPNVVFDAIRIVSSETISQIKQNDIEPAVAAIPEPSTWAMMLIGFGAVGYSLRRRRRTMSLQAV